MSSLLCGPDRKFLFNCTVHALALTLMVSGTACNLKLNRNPVTSGTATAPASSTEPEAPPFCSGDLLTAAPFATGSGTRQDPYLICTATQLDQIRLHLTSHFRLASDIDLAGVSFEPIANGSIDFVYGNAGSPFAGTLDGANHIIRNWAYVAPHSGQEQDAVGFVSRLGFNAVIANLQLEDIRVTGRFGVGGLVGWNDGVIVNSSVRGLLASHQVEGSYMVGGLVGYHSSGVIENSHAAIRVRGNGDPANDSGWWPGTALSAGGLVGNVSGEVRTSYAASPEVIDGTAAADGIQFFAFAGSMWTPGGFNYALASSIPDDASIVSPVPAVQLMTFGALPGFDYENHWRLPTPGSAYPYPVQAITPRPVPVTPVIDSISPLSGFPGSTVSLLGSGFSSATEVRFNGTAVGSFTIVSDTEIQAVVPAFASSGTVSVRTPFSATSADPFTVLSARLELAAGSASPNVGAVLRNTTHEFQLTLTNPGNEAVNSMVVSSAPSHGFEFVSGIYPGSMGGCTDSLAAGATCTLSLVFTPTTLSDHRSELEISYFDGTATRRLLIQLAGYGDEVRILSAGSVVDFGAVRSGGTAHQLVSAYNPGKAVVALSASITAGAGQFQLQTGTVEGLSPNCGATLAAKSACQFLVSFTPAGVAPYTGEISIQWGTNPAQALALSGSGVAAPTCACNPADSATFGAATGGTSWADAYQVCSRAHLTRIRTALGANGGWSGKYFMQCSDIDLGGAATPFTPMGTYSSYFRGSYDGNHHLISSLYFVAGAFNSDPVGLFGAVSGASLKNVKMKDVSLTGAGSTGGLVGATTSGTSVSNSYATGSISGSGFGTGGLVGNLEDYSTVTVSFSTVSQNSYYYAGGLVGVVREGSTVTRSYATGSILSQGGAGGLAGDAWGDVALSDVYATGVVVASDGQAGGLSAGFSGGTVERAIATGTVSATDYAGGLFAGGSDATVNDSSALGEVVGEAAVGGLIGRAVDIIITNSFAAGSVSSTNSGWGGAGGLVGDGARCTISDSQAKAAVSGQDYAGGLIGQSYLCNMTNSHASGAVRGTKYVGGLVGSAIQGTVINSSATGSVSGGDYSGGLVGSLNSTPLTNSFSSGSTSGNNYTGGLAGEMISSPVSATWSTGPVSGHDYTGGLAGSVSQGTLIQSHTTSSVSGRNWTGGFAGMIQNSASIADSYARGPVSGSNYTGGFVGLMLNSDLERVYSGAPEVLSSGTPKGAFVGASFEGTFQNSHYWASGVANSVTPAFTSRGYSPAGIVPLSATQMQTPSSFIGWDFLGIWQMSGSGFGFPELR